jgi:hypothetical protein
MGDAIDPILNEILGDQDDEPTPAPTPGQVALSYTTLSNRFGRAVRIFPCWSGAKEPAVQGSYKVASDNPDQVRAWWERWPTANLGLACGLNGILVIDVDVKGWRTPPLDGGPSLAALEEKYGKLPATLEARTRSGGRHLFFAAPQIKGGTNAFGPEYPGLDVQSQGRYVLLPPSIVRGSKEPGEPSSGSYTWTNDLPLAELPPEWLAAVRRVDRERKASESNGSGGTGEGYTLPLEIRKGDRRDELIRYGGQLVGWRRSDDEIDQLLRKADRERCKPPYAGSSQASKLDKIIREVQGFPKPKPIEDVIAEMEAQAAAFKALSTDEIVEILNEAENQPDPEPQPVPESTTGEVARWETPRELRNRLGGTTEWIVDNMLAVGDVSILIAKQGVGKSTFDAQLARCVAKGLPFLGRAVMQGPVLYFGFEGVAKTNDVLFELEGDPYSDLLNDGRIKFWTAGTSGDPVTWLLRTVAQTGIPRLIVIDTLADLIRARHGANSGGYDDVVEKLGAILRWAESKKTHVHFSHHGKKGALQSLDDALGTTANTSKPGTVLLYSKLTDETDGRRAPRALKGDKNRKGRDVTAELPPTVIGWDLAQGGLYVLGPRQEVVIGDLGERLLRRMIAFPGRRLRDLMESEREGGIPGNEQEKWQAYRAIETEGLVRTEGTAKSRTNPITVWAADEKAVDRWREIRRVRPARPDEEV